jgi:integrase
LTVADFLERWLKHATDKVSPKTHERYSEIARKNLIPAFGTTPLAKLQPLQIEEFYTEALRTGRKDGRGGLSPQTVVHFHRVLRAALNQAVKWRLVARNIAEAVEPPRVERREMRALDETETAKLLEAAEGTRMYTPIMFDVSTGVRRGEMLALRWSDLDLDKASVCIQRSLEQTRAGLRFKEIKKGKGRTLALPEITVEVLRMHKAQQDQLRELLGGDYNPENLVFCRDDGNIWKPESFTDEYFRWTQKIGVKVRFHDLRHSHATHLLRLGVSPKVVAERLGHSSVGITLDRYSHVLKGMQEEAAEKIDSVLRTAMEKEKRPLI